MRTSSAYKAAGYDLKIKRTVKAARGDSALKAAHRVGVRVAGHLPDGPGDEARPWVLGVFTRRPFDGLSDLRYRYRTL